MRTSRRPSTWTKWALIRSGNAGWLSIAGPSSSNGTPAASWTKVTQWGLPIETQVTRSSCPFAVSDSSMHWLSGSPAMGMSLRSSRGGPMLTRTVLTLPLSTVSLSVLRPASVSTVISSLDTSPWSYAYLATQRMPLPHIWASLPSALNMRMRTWALSDGRMSIRPSAPMPKWRSLTKGATAAGSSTVSSKPLTYT